MNISNLENVGRQFRQEVENDHGWGKFSLMIKEQGGDIVSFNVPAINTDHSTGNIVTSNLLEQAVYNLEIPLIAVRNGSRGVCSYLINSELIPTIHHIARAYHPYVRDPHWSIDFLEAKRFYDLNMVDSNRTRRDIKPPQSKLGFDFPHEYVEIVGKTVSRNDFAAWLYFET